MSPKKTRKVPDTGYGYALRVIHSRLVKLDSKVDRLAEEMAGEKAREAEKAAQEERGAKAKTAVLAALVSGIIALVTRFIP